MNPSAICALIGTLIGDAAIRAGDAVEIKCKIEVLDAACMAMLAVGARE